MRHDWGERSRRIWRQQPVFGEEEQFGKFLCDVWERSQGQLDFTTFCPDCQDFFTVFLPKNWICRVWPTFFPGALPFRWIWRCSASTSATLESSSLQSAHAAATIGHSVHQKTGSAKLYRQSPSFLCRRWELNPHGHKAHCALNAARLPVPPLRHSELSSAIRCDGP